MVFSILLYDSEALCLREDLFNRLHFFHNRCVRSMCRITMAHTMKHRITFKSLFERLGVGSFDSYYNRRLLRWAVLKCVYHYMEKRITCVLNSIPPVVYGTGRDVFFPVYNYYYCCHLGKLKSLTNALPA